MIRRVAVAAVNTVGRAGCWFLDRVDRALCGWANTTGDTDD